MNANRLKKMILAGLGIYAQVNGKTKFHNSQYQQTISQNSVLSNPMDRQSINETNEYVRNLLNIPDIIQHEDMPINNEVFKNIEKITNDTRTNMNKVFKSGMSNLLEDEVKNQVAQILNYENNTTFGTTPLVGLLANCNMVLKKYNNDSNEITKRTFEQSLDNTVNVFYNRESYETYVNALKVNDKKSFIVAPIMARNHLFSAVLYKKSAKGKTYFEVVVVNKGGRIEEIGNLAIEHRAYERYKISQENISKIVDMLGYNRSINENGKHRTTGEMYEKLRHYAINNSYEELGYITSRNQIIGNCYYKELEAGFKYAYSNAYDEFEIRIVEGREYNIPKWPIDTMEFQKELIYNIKDVIKEVPLITTEKDRIDEYIDRMISRYVKNKHFRKTLERQQEMNDEVIMNAFIRNFGQQKVVNVDNDLLKETLKDVDFITFNRYRGFFMELLKSSGAEVPEFLQKVSYGEDVTKYVAKYMHDNGHDKGDFLKEYLPAVYEVVEQRYDRNKVIATPNERQFSDRREKTITSKGRDI